ncbi:MAG TPA: hypothetical protein VH370_08300 [Humisphaera sp.]|nr:hypothetical protein [Humisphaera sp.]
MIVVLLAALPIVISLCGVMIAKHGAEFLLDFDADFLRPALDPKSGRTWQLTFVFFAGATMPPVLPIGVIITFCLGLSAPGLWFRAGGIDEQRQMRLIAISRYACAPWAWLIVPTAAFVAALWIANVVAGGYGEMDSRLLYSSGATMLFVLISAWWTNIRMLARTTRCGVFYMLAAGISLPVTWAVSAAIGLGLFPCVVGLVWIIIDSLRR